MNIEKVLVSEPVLQSRAALVLLKKNLLRKVAYFGYQGWLRFRWETLNKWAKNNPLICFYCKKGPLEIESDNQKILATLDHVVPISQYKGSKFDLTNIVVACYSCNVNKKDKSVKEFLKLKKW